MCDVRNMSYVTAKVLDLFATHCLSLIAGIEQKFVTVFKQAVI